MALSFMANFLYSQLLVTPSYPTVSFAGQIAIVTGSNTGLGLEAARHIVRLGAEKVILAVRNTSKGEAAKQSIEDSTQRSGIVEVWSLDLSSYESVKQFAKRAQSLRRLDLLLENAGMMQNSFTTTEQDESTVTTNVTSTFLLALLVLPKLQETAQNFNTLPRLTIVASDAHFITKFKERKAERIFDELNNEKGVDMLDRYGSLVAEASAGILLNHSLFVDMV
jgi:retinol dehydrogenase-12